MWRCRGPPGSNRSEGTKNLRAPRPISERHSSTFGVKRIQGPSTTPGFWQVLFRAPWAAPAGARWTLALALYAAGLAITGSEMRAVGPGVTVASVVAVATAGWFLGWRWGMAFGVLNIATIPLLLLLLHTEPDHVREASPILVVGLFPGTVTGAVRKIIANRERVARREKAILDSSADLVLLLDPQGRMAYISAAARELFGYEPAEHVGEPFLDFVHPDDRPHVLEVFRKALAAPRDIPRASFRVRHEDGSWRHVETTGVNLTQDPDIGRVLVAVRDVTERDRLQAGELAAQAREAELRNLRDLQRRRQQFVNLAAHEFATPLTPLRIQLHLLRQEAGKPDADRQHQALDVVERSLRRLERVVRNLVFLALLDETPAPPAATTFDLVRLLGEVAADQRLPAQAAQVHVSLHAAPSLPIEGDPAALRTAVENLVDNAMKFTPPGGRVDLEAGPAEDAVVVRVRDTGIGLTHEQAQHLLEPYEQHDAVAHSRAGLGVGLLVCRAIVEQHGGTLEGTSPGPNQGATFTITLPVRHVKPRAAPPAAQGPGSPAPGEGGGGGATS